MEEHLIPPRLRVLSGSMLKVLATIAMFVDHAAAHVLLWTAQTAPFTAFDKKVTVYFAMRAFGRIAFPIFCFLMVEGYLHTRDRRAYGLRLGLFAVISELPWNLLHSGELLMPLSQSVFVTLFLAYCGLCLLGRLERSDEAGERHRNAVLLVAIFVAMEYSCCDYGCKALGCVFAIYILRTWPLPRALVAASCLNNAIYASLAFIPIGMYNGKRGFIRGRVLQLLFYVIYPAHMMLLWWIRLHGVGW